MNLLIDPLVECWMVDDALMLESDSIVLVVYLVLRHEILRMFYMIILLFDTRLIGLEVSDLTQPVIGSGNQTYKGYWVSIKDYPLFVSWDKYPMCFYSGKSLIKVIRIEIKKVLRENLIRMRLK